MTADTEVQNGQTKVDILTRRGIPLVFEDYTYRVRPRTVKKDREWLGLVFERVTRRIEGFAADDLSVSTVIAALGNATDDMLDLICAYDESGILPDRDKLEDRAYTEEVLAAFTTLLEVAYPPFVVSRRLLPADRRAEIIGSLLSYVIEQAARDGSFAPTDSPSNTGGSEVPKKSKRPSPTARSKS